MEARRRFYVGVCGRRAISEIAHCSSAVLLEHERTKALRGLCDVWRSAGRINRRHSTTGNDFGVREDRCRYPAVVLRRHNGSFFTSGISDDLLHVLVAALWWFPVRVAEALRNGVDIQLVEKGLVRFLVRRSGDRRHIGAVKCNH